MKLIKQDAGYKYYQLSERDSDAAMVYEDIVAISKEDLKYMKPREALEDGAYKPCAAEYAIKPGVNPLYVLDPYVVIPESIQIDEE